MENFVQIVFIIALLKYCLNASSVGRLWALPIYATVLALFSLAIYPWVITVPGNIIEQLLASKAIVTDIAVLTTVEAVCGVFISIMLLDNYFTPSNKRKKWHLVFKIVPGVIVIAAVAYFELLFFKMNVGASFAWSAALFALIVFGLVLLISWFLYKNVNHESVRLELKILLNLAILVIGLLINSSIADYNLSNSATQIEWGALVAIVAIVLTMFIAGIYVNKIDFKRILKLPR